MKVQDLPKIGEHLDGGIFAGLTTNKDGTHCAVVLLPGKGYDLNWSDAKAWATEQGGELPSRPVAAAEREECAKVAEEGGADEPYGHAKARAYLIADAIRARGKT